MFAAGPTILIGPSSSIKVNSTPSELTTGGSSFTGSVTMVTARTLLGKLPSLT